MLNGRLLLSTGDIGVSKYGVEQRRRTYRVDILIVEIPQKLLSLITTKGPSVGKLFSAAVLKTND